MTDEEQERMRRMAELTFPCRLTFDGPIIGLAQMARKADACFEFACGSDRRVAFYFRSARRQEWFIKDYGYGRVPTENELRGNGVFNRGAPAHSIEIKLPGK
ncbi:hypothetical protein BN1012_Phect2584 [Candidatus Phaeomarinobacter ectocarpi]|uniref:Uncharacterized protein n=1 Tax=Candidatus Phaeomarinibacter ectocarpi TaxID=1458461 RepID=X5MEA5_9HYPH|nr:hypothetical protein [Candidatus Phaeomarinobacter ectocarpi]CDO60797.1 hypothetical protein BN1012_Phect2584 [Candidatus Phaeomarinobacter ectocarpi]